jgi:hypothetical protein
MQILPAKQLLGKVGTCLQNGLASKATQQEQEQQEGLP